MQRYAMEGHNNKKGIQPVCCTPSHKIFLLLCSDCLRNYLPLRASTAFLTPKAAPAASSSVIPPSSGTGLKTGPGPG